MKLASAAYLIALIMAGCSGENAPEGPVIARVETAEAERRDVHVQVEAPARIIPRQQASVAARITAPIESLGAHMGDVVREGQVLARLVRNDLEAQRAEAAAQVQAAEANLAKVITGSLPADIERAQGAVETAAAALERAEKIYKRRVELFKEGAIPEREVLVSRTDFEQAKTAHRVAERSLELLQNRSREQDERIARQQLEQARARLAYLDAQLSFTEVRSPFGGVITRQFLYPGDVASPAAPVFTIVDLSEAIAVGQFPEEKAGEVRESQPCWFEAADAPGTRIEGKVSVVNAAVDVARRTVEVWCRISGSGSSLRAGQFGTVGVVTAKHADAVMAPLAAVQFIEGTNRGTVWTVDGAGLARSHQVTTGVVDSQLVEITSGLTGKERVVTAGALGLSDGMRVEEKGAEGNAR